MTDDPPAERWLIDGNNVMGSRPDGWWRDRTGAMIRLTTGIARWATTTGRSVVLVFDGRPDAVALRFAGGGRPDAADDVIVELQRPGDAVVSADRGLIARLVPGVTTVGPRTLLGEIDRLGGWSID